MSAAIRGWCPDLFAPMRSGDGWLSRIKPRLARISAAEGRLIADGARRHGNGSIELTGRGNLQLRGLTEASAKRFAREAVAAGLASADPAVERRRNILLSPLATAATCEVACALERGLADAHALAALPGKFGFAVDGGGAFALGDAAADIVLRATEGDAWSVSDGRTSIRCDGDAAPASALTLARRWLDCPDRVRRPAPGATDPDVIGWLADCGAFGFGLPFGAIDAATLEALCVGADRYGDGVLHLTPWRAILLSGVPEAAAAPLAIIGKGLIVGSDDPRRLASACIGTRGCPQGSVDARGDAVRLLEAGLRTESLHVSGCAKGCAHPSPAAITLVGHDGRYGLVRQGRAGDTPESNELGASDLARYLGVGNSGGSASGS